MLLQSACGCDVYEASTSHKHVCTLCRCTVQGCVVRQQKHGVCCTAKQNEPAHTVSLSACRNMTVPQLLNNKWIFPLPSQQEAPWLQVTCCRHAQVTGGRLTWHACCGEPFSHPSPTPFLPWFPNPYLPQGKEAPQDFSGGRRSALPTLFRCDLAQVGQRLSSFFYSTARLRCTFTFVGVCATSTCVQTVCFLCWYKRFVSCAGPLRCCVCSAVQKMLHSSSLCCQQQVWVAAAVCDEYIGTQRYQCTADWQSGVGLSRVVV
jgi:hypothetical protein